MTQEIDFNEWLAGIASVEDDHIFTPVGSQSDRMTELLNERANLLTQPKDDEDAAGGERSLSETFTDRRTELDKEIQDQLEQDHPDAPRIRLRGLSDEDIEIINDEVDALQVEGKKLDRTKVQLETNLRLVARACVAPSFSPQDVRLLRRKLNRGEWSRLLDHVIRLMTAESEAVELPNS